MEFLVPSFFLTVFSVLASSASSCSLRRASISAADIALWSENVTEKGTSSSFLLVDNEKEEEKKEVK